MLIIPRDERELVDRTIVVNYYFNLGREDAEIDMNQFEACIPLGSAALCNHSSDPNAKCIVISGLSGYFFVLTSLKEISPGEEICTKYTNLWFDPLS